MPIVYRHRRLDTNEVFYIGMGKDVRRSKTRQGRSQFWHNIVNKVGFNVEIIQEDISFEEALELEEFLILEYGRRCLGTGVLCNISSGGSGNRGVPLTKEHKSKLSKAKLGIPRKEIDKLAISNSMLGVLKPLGNKCGNPKTIVAIDIITNKFKIYKSIKSCSEKLKLNRPSISRVLSGSLNQTGGYTFKYL